MNKIDEKLKQLEIEDFIWIIYIGIIILSFYSNELEKKYFLYNDLASKKKYRLILILIFLVLIIVYLYFLKNAILDIKNLKINDSNKKKNLVYASFLASLLITISGIIFLIIAILDEELDIELAFN